MVSHYKYGAYLPWVDISKGIGILLVVFAHIETSKIRDLIYIFHMPLFIIISGYLHSYHAFSNVFFKKIRQMMVPYFSYLVALFFLYLLSSLLIKGDVQPALRLIEGLVLGGKYMTGWFSVFWFITALFATILVYSVVSIKNSIYVRHIIAFFFLTFNCFGDVPNLPWALDTLLVTFPCFHFGAYLKSKGVTYPFLFVMLASFCGVVLFLISPKFFLIDYKIGEVGVPYIGFLFGVIFSLFVISISEKISKLVYINDIFIFLGKSSLTIMFLPQPLQITLKHYFPFTNNSLILSLFVISICSIFHLFLNQNRVCRVLFLGVSK